VVLRYLHGLQLFQFDHSLYYLHSSDSCTNQSTTAQRQAQFTAMPKSFEAKLINYVVNVTLKHSTSTLKQLKIQF